MSEEEVGARVGRRIRGNEDRSHHGKRREGGGEISFAPVTTDHKNTKGRKEEKEKREGGRISATSGMTEHGGVRERGVGREMGGILGV